MSQIINKIGFIPDSFSGHTPVALADYASGGALALAIDDNLDEVASHFDTLALITIPFAGSADGRGFSIAAILRQLGYTGHLRASGHILVDQFRAALRCGFDDIEISASQARRNPEIQWQAVPHETGYQTHITG